MDDTTTNLTPLDGGHKLRPMVLPCELKKKGGAWLGAARTWLQWNRMAVCDEAFQS